MPALYTIMNQDFHLIKRKNSKGKPLYYVAFLDSKKGKNGKPRYKAMKNTGQGNRSAAEKVARELLADGKILASKDNLRYFLLSFWDSNKSEYLKSKQAEDGKSISLTYCMSNIQRIKDYFLPFFEERGLNTIRDLDRKTLTEWRNWLFEQGKISPASQNKVRQAVFVALQYAVDMGMLPYHPGASVKRVKAKTPERLIFQLDELKSLFMEPWADVRCHAACLLAVTTGARLGEVRGLKIKNVHLQERYIDVVDNYVARDGLKPPKWDSVRLGVPVPDITVQALYEVMNIHLFKDDPESFVFFTPYSKNIPMDGGQIAKALKERMKECALPLNRSFHCLRHTYITHLSGSLPESKLARLVGHSNVRTTAGYTHATDEDAKIMRLAIDGLITE